MTPATTPTLMLLHGARMSPPSWQDVVTELGASRPLTAPWLRGLKPTQSGEFDIDAAVSDLLTRIDLDDLEQVDVCGVQLGGMVALRLAAEQPKAVRRLVLIDTPVAPGGGAGKVSRTLMRLMPESAFTEQGVTKQSVLAALDAMASIDVSAHLGKVTAPTLVLTSDDKAAQMSAEALTTKLASAEWRAIRGSNLLRDHAGEVAAAITEWLAR